MEAGIKIKEVVVLSREELEKEYPLGRLDHSLMVVGGNRQMYEVMGAHIYSTLYSVVPVKDIPKLQAAVALCDSEEKMSGEECLHIENADGTYDTYVARMRKGKDFEGYEIELHNVSTEINNLRTLRNHLVSSNIYLTMSGNALFSYDQETEEFHLFWKNYAQTVDIYRENFQSFEEKMIREGNVDQKSQAIFHSFCEAVRTCEKEQTFTFRGRMLTRGQNLDTYRVKFVQENADAEHRVVGLWRVVSESTGEELDDYIEGIYQDSMTGVLNKKAVMEYGEAAVKEKEEIAVCMMDIDNFKSINDNYGHMFGDQVIIAVVNIIQRVIGNDGVVGRFGGDEFMMILKNCQDESKLRNYLRGIKTNVQMLFQDKVGSNKITCSIGVARAPLDSSDFKGAYQIADKALYLAKQKGKNRYIIYKTDLHGQLHMKGESNDLTEIKSAFFSVDDLSAFNQGIAGLVLEGRSALPVALEKMAHVLTVNRIVILWGKDRRLLASYPPEMKPLDTSKVFLFECKEYAEQFQHDMLCVSNINVLEYSMPEIHHIYHETEVYSVMQHYLRDRDGNIFGFVSAEENSQVRNFPKIATQIFENFCKVLNAVLLKEEIE